MSRDPKHDILFEPVRIGQKTMRNRFYQTPHCNSLGVIAPGAQAEFRGIKAEGGWAVVNTEYCSIHPESDDRPKIGTRLWDDADVRNLSWMCDKVHEHDSLAGVELFFGGVHGSSLETRLPSRGVSQITDESAFMHSCYAMTKAEIRELQGFYVAAAERARSAGFDIVNVYGGEVGSITQHFLMRFFNKRTDEYGGSLENRSRFWLETIELVKEAVGDDCVISVRMCIDTLDESDTGIRVDEEGVGFIRLADDLVDLWDFQTGGWASAKWGEDARSSRHSDENFAGAWIAKASRETQKPVVGVGRFTNPDTMVDVIRSGQQDIIGAARPSIADPFLPKKIEEGRLDDIRECIGCNMCVARYNQSTPIICTQNATSGEEYRRGWHPERFDRAANADSDVLVVGAGPAGMECAMILGQRGMRRVHLVDAEAEIGGCMRWIPSLPGLGEWGRVVDYRKIQIDKQKNVELIPSTELDAAGVGEYGADIVIIATGSSWVGDGISGTTHEAIPGADACLPYCLTPEQIMLEGKEVGERVLIYDCDGYFMGTSLAEKLASEGAQTTLVTPFGSVAPYTVFTGEAYESYRTLKRLGVRSFPSQVVSQIQPGGVSAFAALDPNDVTEWEVDSVVLVTQRLSHDRLYRELEADADRREREGICGLYRIGDCLVPRLIADCIFDGHRLAREIDTPDPSTPLPFIREHLVVGDPSGDLSGSAVSAGADAR